MPSGEILSLEAALNAAQVAHRGSLGTVVEPELGPLRVFGMTAKFEKTPGALETPPPRLGAHTREVLELAGYTAAQIDAFARRVWCEKTACSAMAYRPVGRSFSHAAIGYSPVAASHRGNRPRGLERSQKQYP